MLHRRKDIAIFATANILKIISLWKKRKRNEW